MGNTLLGDEGVGVAAVRWLEAHYRWPAHVRLLDGGTQGLMLMADVQECEFLLVLDAVLGPGKPGSFYLAQAQDLGAALRPRSSLHQTSLPDLLALCDLAGCRPEAMLLGFEPFAWKLPQAGLSPQAQAILPGFCARAAQILADIGAGPL